MQRRQGDDQRGEHPRRLFGVAVADEEAALVVDQQLVQLGHHAGCRRPSRWPRDSATPASISGQCLPRDAHAIGGDLPGAAHGGVDQRLAAAAIGCTLGRRDQLRGRASAAAARRSGRRRRPRSVARASGSGPRCRSRPASARFAGHRPRVVDRFHERFPPAQKCARCRACATRPGLRSAPGGGAKQGVQTSYARRAGHSHRRHQEQRPHRGRCVGVTWGG